MPSLLMLFLLALLAAPGQGNVEFLCKSRKSHDAVISVLLELTSGPNCTGPVSGRALSVLESVEAVLAKVNGADPSVRQLIPGVTIGARYLDICSEPQQAIKLLASQMSLTNWGKDDPAERSKTFCSISDQGAALDDKTTLIGVIGPMENANVGPLASFAALSNVAVISPGAPAGLFSDREKFPTLFHTFPVGMDVMVQGMVNTAVALKWNSAITITTDDQYGRDTVSFVHQAAITRKICILQNLTIPLSLDEDGARALVNQFIRSEEGTDALGVFYLGPAKPVASFLRYYLSEQAGNTRPLVWLTSAEVGRSSEVLQEFAEAPPHQRTLITLITLSPSLPSRVSRRNFSAALARRMQNITAGGSGGLQDEFYHRKYLEFQNELLVSRSSASDLRPTVSALDPSREPKGQRVVTEAAAENLPSDWLEPAADAALAAVFAYAATREILCDQPPEPVTMPPVVRGQVSTAVPMDTNGPPPCPAIGDTETFRSVFLRSLTGLLANMSEEAYGNYSPWQDFPLDAAHVLEFDGDTGQQVSGDNETLDVSLVTGEPPTYLQIGQVLADSGTVNIDQVETTRTTEDTPAVSLSAIPRSLCSGQLCMNCIYRESIELQYYYRPGTVLIAGSGLIRKGCMFLEPPGYLRFEMLRYTVDRLNEASPESNFGILFVDTCRGASELSMWVAEVLGGHKKLVPTLAAHQGKAGSSGWEGHIIQPRSILGWVAGANGAGTAGYIAILNEVEIPVISYEALAVPIDSVLRPHFLSTVPSSVVVADFLMSVTQELCQHTHHILYSEKVPKAVAAAREYQQRASKGVRIKSMIGLPSEYDKFAKSLSRSESQPGAYVYFGATRSLKNSLLKRMDARVKAAWRLGNVLVVAPNSDYDKLDTFHSYETLLRGSVIVRHNADETLRAVAFGEDSDNEAVPDTTPRDGQNSTVGSVPGGGGSPGPSPTQVAPTFDQYLEGVEVDRNSPSYNTWLGHYMLHAHNCPNDMHFVAPSGEQAIPGIHCSRKRLLSMADLSDPLPRDTDLPFLAVSVYALGRAFIETPKCALEACAGSDEYLTTLRDISVTGAASSSTHRVKPFDETFHMETLFATNVMYNAESDTTFELPVRRGRTAMGRLTVYNGRGTLASVMRASGSSCHTCGVYNKVSFPTASASATPAPGQQSTDGANKSTMTEDEGPSLSNRSMSAPGHHPGGSDVPQGRPSGGSTTTTPLSGEGSTQSSGGASSSVADTQYVAFISLLSVLSVLIFLLVIVLVIYMMRRNQKDRWVAENMARAMASGLDPMDSACRRCRHEIKDVNAMNQRIVERQAAVNSDYQYIRRRGQRQTDGREPGVATISSSASHAHHHSMPHAAATFELHPLPDINTLPHLKCSPRSPSSLDPDRSPDIRSLDRLNFSSPDLAAVAEEDMGILMSHDEDDSPSTTSGTPSTTSAASSRGRDSGYFVHTEAPVASIMIGSSLSSARCNNCEEANC